MEMQESNFTIKDDPASQLLELLCGQVFHVTKRTSYPEIIKTGAIQNNKNGHPFGLENTGSGENSYSVVNGCVGSEYNNLRLWLLAI